MLHVPYFDLPRDSDTLYIDIKLLSWCVNPIKEFAL